MDTRTLYSLRYVQDQSEGSKERERHYEIFPEREAYVEQPRDALPAEARRRPAAEIECVRRPGARAFRLRKAQGELAPHAVDVIVEGHDPPDRDAEVAVRAPARAERDVNVDVTGLHAWNLAARGRLTVARGTAGRRAAGRRR